MNLAHLIDSGLKPALRRISWRTSQLQVDIHAQHRSRSAPASKESAPARSSILDMSSICICACRLCGVLAVCKLYAQCHHTKASYTNSSAQSAATRLPYWHQEAVTPPAVVATTTPTADTPYQPAQTKQHACKHTAARYDLGLHCNNQNSKWPMLSDL
jgi:hypothetical protein